MQTNDPWLVALSVVLFGATVAVVALARRRVWAASGSALVATTAAANLLRAGHLAGSEAPGPSGHGVRLEPVTAPPAPHPVEQAIYELVDVDPDRPFREVQKRVADTPAVAALRERLRGQGLVLTAGEEAGYRGGVLLVAVP